LPLLGLSAKAFAQIILVLNPNVLAFENVHHLFREECS